MLISKIKIKDKFYRVGDKLKFISTSNVGGFSGLLSLTKGDLVRISIIKDNRKKSGYLMGIITDSGLRPEGWHNLDGYLTKNIGYFIEECHLLHNFAPVASSMIVSKSFSFKRRDLKNMECKVVSSMPGNEESIVEFKEDIGGCGADGLGKAGYCLVIPNNVLSPVKEEGKEKAQTKLCKSFTHDNR